MKLTTRTAISLIALMPALWLSVGCDKTGGRVKIDKKLNGDSRLQGTGSKKPAVLVGRECLRVDKLPKLLVESKTDLLTVHTADLDIGRFPSPRDFSYTSDSSTSEDMHKMEIAQYFLVQKWVSTLFSATGPEILDGSIGNLIDIKDLDEKCEKGSFRTARSKTAGMAFSVIEKGPRFLVLQLEGSDNEIRSYSLGANNSLSITVFRPIGKTKLCKRETEGLVSKETTEISWRDEGSDLTVSGRLLDVFTGYLPIPTGLTENLDFAEYSYIDTLIANKKFKDITCE